MGFTTSFSQALASNRKRGYTTFKREISEGGQEVVNLEGDDPLPPVKKRKRIVDVIDFTQDDDDEEDDKPLFSPASTSQHPTSTCMSCYATKPKDSFSTDLGLAICRRCWEASTSAEEALERTRTLEQEQEQGQEQECSICYDTSPTHDFPTMPHEGAEGHTVCISCWERHLHTEIERKDWDNLSCPQDGCKKILAYSEIAVLDERFEKPVEPILATKATASYLKQDETYFACPSATCKSGNFLDEDDDNNVFTCTACNFAFCLSCEVPMHVGQSCGNYQGGIDGDAERTLQERLSEDKIKNTYRTCACGSKLDKMSGCDHVVCLHCKRAFDWRSLPKPVKKKSKKATVRADAAVPQSDRYLPFARRERQASSETLSMMEQLTARRRGPRGDRAGDRPLF